MCRFVVNKATVTQAELVFSILLVVQKAHNLCQLYVQRFLRMHLGQQQHIYDGVQCVGVDYKSCGMGWGLRQCAGWCKSCLIWAKGFKRLQLCA